MIRLSDDQYDSSAGTITLRQKKTRKAMTLHVPALLAGVLDREAAASTVQRAARPTNRLQVSPRGKPWTMDNAQQTLAALLKRLGLPRYTLHGLRSTGPSALRQLGMGNAHLRGLTGHDSDSNLEVYLRHANTANLTKEAQDALATVFSSIVGAHGG